MRLLGCHPVLFFLFVLLLLLLLLLLMYSRDVPFISEMFALPPLPFFSYFLSSLFSFILPVPHCTPPSSGLYRCRQPYRRKRAGVQKQRKISVRVTDPLNRKLPSITNSISPLNLMPIHTIKWRLPTFLNSNTRSIMNKIDEITNLIDVNHVDIACVTETWLSDEVPPCVTGIDGYTCERRDRVDRRGGGVLIYIRNGIPYRRIENLECDEVESLWLLVRDKCMPRGFSHILIGVVYHPPGACNLTTTNHIITSLDDIIKKHPHAGVMLLGDFNKLNDTQLRSYPLKQVVKLPTRRTAILDKILPTWATCMTNQSFLLHLAFLTTMLYFLSLPPPLSLMQVKLCLLISE